MLERLGKPTTGTTDRVIVAGGGRIGLRTARELSDRGYDIVVIEREDGRSASVADERVGTVLNGDATAPSVLAQADVDRATAVAALTDEPGTNLAVCMEAKGIDPGVATLARTGAGTEGEYDGVVDATVFPQAVGAAAAVDVLAGDGVRTLVDGRDGFEILEVAVADGAPVAGHTLDEVRLPEGGLVVSGRGRAGLADSGTELVAGERYVVAVEAAVVDEVLNLFGE